MVNESNKQRAADIAAILQGYITGGGIKHYVEPFARNFDVIANIKCGNRLANNGDSDVCDRLERTRHTARGVLVGCCRYWQLRLPRRERALIFCSPPPSILRWRKPRKSFWRWCRRQARLGHIVIVRAWDAPPDFVQIWEHEYLRVVINGKIEIAKSDKIYIYGGVENGKNH